MDQIDWVALGFGILFVILGIALFASKRLAALVLQYDGKGVAWREALGEKKAGWAMKYVSSLGGIGFGAWIIYHAIYGY